eukprot:PhM_4_TR7191/c0_g1_i1/m.86596/K00809/DHPS, dys; deoxyhypusine synthase
MSTNVFEKWHHAGDVPQDVKTFVSEAYRGAGGQGNNIEAARALLDKMVAEKDFIVLGFSSNMISSGVREHFLHLVKNKLVGAIVATAGGVEEDIIKCVGGHTYLGDFSLDGHKLRDKGLNRIGNLLVPNNNYVNFEDFMMPLLDANMGEGVVLTPSSFIKKLGDAMNNPESVYYWCARNDIPVFCPALTDGSIGDMMFFHSLQKKPGVVVDVMGDVRAFRDLLASVPQGTKISTVLVGAGLPKHHTLRAARMAGRPLSRMLAFTTGHVHENSSSACVVEDDVREGGLAADVEAVIARVDATLAFPLAVASLLSPKE